MPSAAVLEKKQAQVSALSDRIKESVAGVLVDYKGINVADDTQLRRDFREAGVEYNVIKNTIIKMAAEKAGLNGLDEVLEGTTAIATCKDDYVASARILQKFANMHPKFKLKSGYIDNEVIDAERLKALAKLPSREILLATVCSAFNAPIAAFARAVQAIVDKNGEGAETDNASEPTAEAENSESAE